MEKRFGALSSSTDPTQIANTVRGAVLALSGVIMYVAGAAGFPLAESEVVALASALGMGAGALWTLYGLVMKAVVYVNDRRGR